MKRESGQVLLAGVIMVTVLLLAVLYMFDVHNVIRGKLKMETGQQAAALTGAAWQRNSLNLIGDINIFKACSALLEGEENWENPLPPVPDASKLGREEYLRQQARRRKALQGRIDLLTEMQTRVAFIGPLIGFAAAQQAAKANGLPDASRRALENYLERVTESYRYRSDFGGAADVINNYRWREPYIALLRELAEQGIAVYPNVRTARAPVTTPAELALEAFYNDILLHAEEIAAGDPPEQSSWHDTLYRFAKEHQVWDDGTLSGKWWHIDFSLNRFPDESEIFTLGVRNGFSPYSGFFGYDDRERLIGRTLFSETSGYPEVQNSLYLTAGDLPGGVEMKWFCYDESWYPEYYRAVADDYLSDHYDYWFGNQVLRKKIKQQYRYEGPAAYVEGTDVTLRRTVRQTARRSVKSPFGKRGVSSITVGPKHDTASASESYATGYRPGAIAKTLGELENDTPPTAVPLVMPVFGKVVLMPTYMPIPYNFSVLRDYSSMLETFLNWLAGEETLRDPKKPLPAGCEKYYDALRQLLERKTFLNYGYNPGCTVTLTLELLRQWEKIRPQHLYTQSNQQGLGWLQEPKLCTDTVYGLPSTEAEVRVTDYVNGGEALRIYTKTGGLAYYVIDAKGKVITNDDVDPTVRYNYSPPGGPGPGFGRPGGKPDLDKGPPRI